MGEVKYSDVIRSISFSQKEILHNIIVLHKGKIVEMGNHQQLLAKKGLYYSLYEIQYKNKN